jgi:spoIIIJ-associated protein
VDEAIELALRELGAERTEVEISVVSRGKSGILGIGGEPARVRVTLIEKANDVVKTASEVLDKLIALMGVNALATVKHAQAEEVGGPIFSVDGDDSGLLIGRKGETLRSLQFMVNFLSSVKLGARPNIVVDVAGYQDRRNKALIHLARNVAQRVAGTGRPITLEPMSPNERRIIHLALAEHRQVTTESTGVGTSRQVIVRPRREGGGGRPPVRSQRGSEVGSEPDDEEPA